MSKPLTGRPAKYTSSVGQVLTGLVTKGHTLDDSVREIGVHPATLYRWHNRHPDLKDGLRYAALQRDRRRYMLLRGPRLSNCVEGTFYEVRD